MTIHQKLLAIQTELKAPKGQMNKFGGYKYRSCEDILEAVKPLLLKHDCIVTLSDELVVIQSNDHLSYYETEEVLLIWDKELKKSLPTLVKQKRSLGEASRFYIKATATIADGTGSISVPGFAREESEKKGMDGSQITGAASSYARKYALNGLFLIDDTKDSDATNTHGKEEPKDEQKKAPPKSPPPEKATPEQLAKITSLCNALGGEGGEAKFWESMKTTPDKIDLMKANSFIVMLQARKTNLTNELDAKASQPSA